LGHGQLGCDFLARFLSELDRGLEERDILSDTLLTACHPLATNVGDSV
jgi:hypothetical protein